MNSAVAGSQGKSTSEKIAAIRAMKGRVRIASLTAYDYPTTKLLDEAGVPLILVGDSLGMVVLGFKDTTDVTMEMMVHHVRAASRAEPSALLAADLPFESYKTPDEAVINARRLIEAGAEAVKAEGGREIFPQLTAIVKAGIPVIGHLGMLPQHVKEEGGYKIKGKSDEERARLIDDARGLDGTGAFAIVLELVKPEVAELITQEITIPTIGIGSGTGCDGQILVTSDLIGSFPWFRPKFVVPRADVAGEIKKSVSSWMKDL